jgi:hypothetical protein
MLVKESFLSAVGDWGSNMLASLPVVKFDDDRLLTLPVTDETRTLVADAIVRSIATQPYLTPLLNPPEPSTGFRDGVLAKGRWATPPLVRGHHPSIENAARYRMFDVSTYWTEFSGMRKGGFLVHRSQSRSEDETEIRDSEDALRTAGDRIVVALTDEERRELLA